MNFKLFKNIIQTAAAAAILGLPWVALAAFDCSKFQAQFQLGSVNIANGIQVYCSAPQLITQVITYALALSGTIAILFLIVGGFWYLTSAGNEEQSEKGKKTIVNSLIGLVVIILSTMIVRVVAGTLTLGK